MNAGAIRAAPSPNHNDRRGAPIDMLVLHYTGMPSLEGALARLRDPDAQVSAHYLIGEDGAIHALVPEERRAWHAGLSFWRGETDINARSIGIELANPGAEWGYRPFPEAQIAALIGLATGLLARHPIPPRNVVGHSDVAPTRKQDPGELFPWERLARTGIGLWPALLPPSPVPATAEDLARYGYDLADPRAAIAAFQRHFRPRRVDGVWDGDCAAQLARLILCEPA